MKQVPKKAFNVQQENHKVHPVQEEIAKCVGTHNLVALVEEDTQTLNTIKTEGLVAFIATLSKNGRVISQGRGSSVLGQNNRFISKAVGYAFNASLADSVLRAKLMDSLRGAPSKAEVEEAYQARDTQEMEPATDKQISYLRMLIQTNVDDNHERDRWESQLFDMSKRDACVAIEQFVK